MDREELRDFIKEDGYATRKQIAEKFSSVQPEIIDSHLDYYVSEGILNRVHFESASNPGWLFYVRYTGE